jgi:hypothetical protein
MAWAMANNSSRVLTGAGGSVFRSDIEALKLMVLPAGRWQTR